MCATHILGTNAPSGLMAELVYAYASGAYGPTTMEVQVLFSPLKVNKRTW